MSVKKPSKGQRSSWVRHPYWYSQLIRGCLELRSGSCFTRWDGAPYCLRITYFAAQKTKLCTGWKGGLITHVWNSKVPQIHLRTSVPPCDRPQAPDNHVRPQDRSACLGSSPIGTLGIVVICLHLQHWILPYKVACQCWWVVQVASYNPDSGWPCTIRIQHLLRVTDTDPPCVISATAASHRHRPSFVASLLVHTVRLAKTGAQWPETALAA